MTDPAKHAHSNDEIDLIELLQAICQQKFFILLITFLCSILGIGYAFISTPSYESTAYLLPPTEKNVIELRKLNLIENYYGNSNIQHSSTSVFQTFLVILQSSAAKHLFFNREAVKSHYVARAHNELNSWKAFNKALSIRLSKNGESSVSVSFQTNDAKLSATWANEYTNLALELTRNQLVADVQEEINSRLNQIDLQIQNRNVLYRSEINTELTKLREALSIAQALNLNDPIKTDTIINQQQEMMVDEVRKLYKLGTQALTAEIKAISTRLDNTDFIPGLSVLYRQKDLLAGIVINPKNIQPAQIDLPAFADKHPIKPKKALVILLATISGVMLGLIFALIRMTVQNRRAGK